MTREIDFPILDTKAIGLRIDRERRENELSVADLSNILGISPQAIYKWPSGKSLPDIANLAILCRLFDKTFEELLFGDEESSSFL